MKHQNRVSTLSKRTNRGGLARVLQNINQPDLTSRLNNQIKEVSRKKRFNTYLLTGFVKGQVAVRMDVEGEQHDVWGIYSYLPYVSSKRKGRWELDSLEVINADNHDDFADPDIVFQGERTDFLKPDPVTGFATDDRMKWHFYKDRLKHFKKGVLI